MGAGAAARPRFGRQAYSGLIQSHMNPPRFSWPNPQNSKLFDMEFPSQSFGKAGADFGACLNGMVQQFFRRLPVPFWQEENVAISLRLDTNSKRNDMGLIMKEDFGSLLEQFRDFGFAGNDTGKDVDEEISGVNLKSSEHFGKARLNVQMRALPIQRQLD